MMRHVIKLVTLLGALAIVSSCQSPVSLGPSAEVVVTLNQGTLDPNGSYRSPQSGGTYIGGTIFQSWTGVANFTSNSHPLPSDLSYAWSINGAPYTPWVQGQTSTYYSITQTGQQTFTVICEAPDGQVSAPAMVQFTQKLSVGSLSTDTTPPNLSFTIDAGANYGSSSGLSGIVNVPVNFVATDNSAAPISYSYLMNGMGYYGTTTAVQLGTWNPSSYPKVTINDFLYQQFTGTPIPGGGTTKITLTVYATDQSGNTTQSQITVSVTVQ